MVHDIDLNIFYDDGEGYVDLGLDNVFTIDDDDNMVPETDRTWVAINGKVVPYYHMDTTEEPDGSNVITGRVPALLNGTDMVNLILVFDDENPKGYIAGAVTDYKEDETDTVAKSMISLNAGDTLDFICDYYTYDGEYSNSYYLGETMTVTDNMEIRNEDVGSGRVKITYRFTDIYNQQYWTESLER